MTKRVSVTLSEKLIQAVEKDTKERGLNLTLSARIALALEKDLKGSK